MTAPTVSVIIPTYNRRDVLPNAAQSVLRQTYVDFELLVVDDGSSDGTDRVVAAFTDPRVRYHSRNHGGIAAAMNAGIAVARGEYIARLDSDDEWLPHMLATLVPALRERPAAGVVYARAQACDEHGTPLRGTKGEPPRYPNDSFRSMLYDDCTCNITVIARRACFARAGGFDETMDVNEDWDMWLRVAEFYPFVFVNDVVARYRCHPGNITRSVHRTAALEGRVAVLDRLYARPVVPPTAQRMRSIAYRNVYLRAALMRWAGGDRAQALANVRSAWRSSRKPCSAVGMFCWYLLSDRVLRRSRLGERFLVWQAAQRRRLRTRLER